MKQISFIVQKNLLATGLIAHALSHVAYAQATDPAVPMPDNPVSLSILPAHVYRAPSITGPLDGASEPKPASGADDWANRPVPSIEKPDNWACRTSNNLSRSSIGRNQDGKTISDIEGRLPKC